jgi:hypothetical protein
MLKNQLDNKITQIQKDVDNARGAISDNMKLL